jgi:DNA-binding NarL/FixJ family response regulator
MTEKKHVSVRLEQDTRGKLEEIAKRRMMATGAAVTLADLIREGLAQFADSELSGEPVAPAVGQPAQQDKPKRLKADDAGMQAFKAQAADLLSQGMTQREVAAALNVSQSKVSKALK